MNTRYRKPSASLVLITFASLACTNAAPPPPPLAAPPPSPIAPVEAGPPKTLTLSVLGLNDLHGRLGALPWFAGYAANLRKAREHDAGGVVLVDAGDMFQGTLESNLTEGASVIAAYNALGMQAAALGNHEFDFGPEGSAPNPQGDPQGALRARIAEARFPILAANLVDASRKLPAWKNLHGSALATVANLRVGFIGVLTSETPRIVMPAYFSGLDVTAARSAIMNEATALRNAGASAVILLAHAGADCEKFDNPEDLSSCSKTEDEVFRLARELPPGSVDAIIGGHTHSGVAHKVNGIAIAEAYSKGKAFSRIDIRLDANTQRVLETTVFPPEPLCPTDPCKPTADYAGLPVTADPAIEKVILPALELADQRRRESLRVVLADALPAVGDEESALGNLFADLTLESVHGADVAIGNGGSLRNPLPAGELVYGKLYEAMPFDNHLASIQITGAELRRVLAAHLTSPGHSLISVGGISVEATCKAGEFVLSMRRRGGKPIADDEKLVLATSDYLATGGDGLFAPAKLSKDRINVDPNVLVRDAFARALRKRKRVALADVFDRKEPRLRLPTPKPVRCEKSG